MAYPKEIHQQAHKLLGQRRDDNRQEAIRREMKLTRELPEARKLLHQLTATSAKLVKSIAAGGNIADLLPKLKEENLSKQKELTQLLEHYGYSADYLEPIYSCPACQDTGFVGSNSCSCLQKILRELTYQRLGVPKHLENCSFQNFYLEKYSEERTPEGKFTIRQQMALALKNCQSYADNFTLHSPSIYMYGDPGLGKTHLSISIAKVVIDQGYDVMYVPFYQLVSRLEGAKFGRNDESYSQLLATINRSELLILDDVGAEFPGQFVVSTLYDIINTRMLEGRPMIINSNLTLPNFEERYTPRVASRVNGTFRTVRFNGIDIRHQNKYSV